MENEILQRIVNLPWPLFLKVVSKIKIEGSFTERMSPDERSLMLYTLVTNLAISDAELEGALHAMRPLSYMTKVNSTTVHSKKNTKSVNVGDKSAAWSDNNYRGDAIRILHLSDFHLTSESDTDTYVRQLTAALETYPPKAKPNYVVISGDFTDKGQAKGFDKALALMKLLQSNFSVATERFIVVPGNHDVVDNPKAYNRDDGKNASNSPREYVALEAKGGGKIWFKRNPKEYRKRFQLFSDKLYKPFFGVDYPQDETEQGLALSFWDDGIQFLTVNSAWEIDEFNRKRSGVNLSAMVKLRAAAEDQYVKALNAGKISQTQPLLRLGVCHHSVLGPEQIQETTFMDDLQVLNTKLLLHGDVHELSRSDYLGYRPNKRVQIVGAGAFGAKATDRPESTPRLFNLLEISKNRKHVRVHTMKREKEASSWTPWATWIKPGAKDSEYSSYFAMDLDWD